MPGARSLPEWPGWIAGLFLAGFLTLPMAAVLWHAGGGSAPQPADWAALRFTVLQALYSAGLSVLLAIPVARALSRRQFRGRALLLGLMGAPFILPVIVAILGLLAVFGRAGWLNQILAALSLPELHIYGMHGVVLAHVFFNLPLATRMILQGWQALPGERFRLAASLGMGRTMVFRVIEWPMLRGVAPGAFAVIFAICLSSFAVALVLGGGPRATTLELAIYQAFRFDFDLGRAAMLAGIQLVLVALATALALRFGGVVQGLAGGQGRPALRPEAAHPLLRLWDAALIALVAAFLLAPLLAVVLRGAPALLALPGPVWKAALVSLGVALAATGLSMGMACALAITALRRTGLELLAIGGLALSPLVVGTGVFLLLNPWTNPTALALPVTVVVNAVMALPFALRLILPRLRQIEATQGRLADSLGLRGLARLRWLFWPQLKPALGFAAGLAAALSMGDLGVIALFSDPQHATLPLQVLRLMGAYKTEAAAGAGLLLLLCSFGLFWLFDRGGRHAAA